MRETFSFPPHLPHSLCWCYIGYFAVHVCGCLLQQTRPRQRRTHENNIIVRRVRERKSREKKKKSNVSSIKVIKRSEHWRDKKICVNFIRASSQLHMVAQQTQTRICNRSQNRKHNIEISTFSCYIYY